MNPSRPIRTSLRVRQAAWSGSLRGLAAATVVLLLALLGVAPAQAAGCTVEGGIGPHIYTYYYIGNTAQNLFLPFDVTVTCTNVPTGYVAYRQFMSTSNGTISNGWAQLLGTTSSFNRVLTAFDPTMPAVQVCNTVPSSDTSIGAVTPSSSTRRAVWKERWTSPGFPAGSLTPGVYEQRVTVVYGYASGGCAPVLDPMAQVDLLMHFSAATLCGITTTSGIAFGDLDVSTQLGAAQTAQGGVAVSCPVGTPYTILLSDGNHALSSGNRQMASSDGKAFLPYQLYQDQNRSIAWGGTGTSGLTKTATASNGSAIVYAAIPSGTTTPGTPGTYTDTVVATVNY